MRLAKSEKVVVNAEGSVVVSFKNGSEVEV